MQNIDDNSRTLRHFDTVSDKVKVCVYVWSLYSCSVQFSRSVVSNSLWFLDVVNIMLIWFLDVYEKKSLSETLFSGSSLKPRPKQNTSIKEGIEVLVFNWAV